MKVLVVRFGALGDVAWTLPALAGYKAASPDVQIEVLTSPRYADLVRCVSGVSRVHVRAPGEGAWAVAGRLAAGGYDRVFDLQGGLRGWVLGARAHAPVSRAELAHLPRRARVWGWGGAPEPPRVERFAQALGVAPLRPRLELPAEVLAWAEERLGPGPCVGLVGSAAWANKRWPPAQLRQLTLALEREGRAVVLVGDEDEEPLLAGIAAGTTARVVARRDLRGVAAVLARCERVVGGDTGLTHLADVLGVPVVALFGPTSPELGYAPTGARSVVLQAPLPCRPCHVHGGDVCARGDRACMTTLSPDQVLAALRGEGGAWPGT